MLLCKVKMSMALRQCFAAAIEIATTDELNVMTTSVVQASD